MEPLALLRKTYIDFPVTCGAIYIGGNPKFSFHCQNLLIQCGQVKKGECSESLWTFNFLFGLLKIANGFV